MKNERKELMMKKRASTTWLRFWPSLRGGAKKPINFNITEDQWAQCQIARP